MEYQKYKELSLKLDDAPRLNRDTFVVSGILAKFERKDDAPSIDLSQLELAFQEVLRRAEIFASHNIQSETLSVRERMSLILDSIKENRTFLRKKNDLSLLSIKSIDIYKKQKTMIAWNGTK